MRTITGMVTNMITRVVLLTGTALGTTRTCTIGIVSPFTAVAILAAFPNHRGVDLISDVLPFGRLLYGGPNAVSNAIGVRNAIQ